MSQGIAVDSHVSERGAAPARWKSVPSAAAAAVILIGLVELTRSIGDIPATAALLYILCAVCLYVVHAEPLTRAWRRAVRLCVGLVTAVALLAITEHLGATSWSIEQLLLSAPADASARFTRGRLAPTSALCFILAATGLWLLTRTSPKRLIAALTVSLSMLVAGFGAVAIAGYVIDALLGYPGWNFTGTPLGAAVPFLLLGLGQVSATATRQRWRWELERATTVCFAAGLILLLGVCTVTYRALNSFADTVTRVTQTHQVQAETGNLQRALIEALSARRNYLLSQEERHLENLRHAVWRAKEHLGNLRRFVQDHPRQRENIAELERSLAGPFARVEEVLENPAVLTLAPPPPAQPRSPANDELLDLLGRINAEEQSRLQGRQTDAKRNFDVAVAVVPAGTFGSVLLLFMAVSLLNREVGDRKRARSELLESERRYRMLFESSPLPKWVFDLETLRFVAVNAATISFYGYSREEFLRMSVTEIRPAEEIEPLLAVINLELPAGNFTNPRFWRHRKKDGTIALMEVTTHNLTFDGRPARLVLANDVTARVQAEQSIRQLNAELELRVSQRTAQLEGAVKEIEAFSYSVSHDLRAPLRHVQGYVALLQRESEGQLSAKAQRHLKTINDASVQMGQLIDDLLDFSRMGRVDMSEGRVALDDLLRESLRGLELVTQGRNIVWKIEALPAVVGDASMLRQVMANLVGNAVKYTRPRDPAEIQIGCAGEENGRPIIFVRDNGAGFDMQYADKLFGVFQRLHRSDEFEGTGIGLATVRRIVSRHGGRVWAEAAIGKGATFYFTLRRAETPPARHIS